MEDQEAYNCKQILGLCHSSPQMEYQVKVEQKIQSLFREKGFHKSNGISLKDLIKCVISISI